MCSNSIVYIFIYTSRRLSAMSGLLASACACAARKWCGENSTHSHHIFLFTPIIALETSSHLRKNNNIGRMTQCAAVLDTSRRLSAMSGLLASACACAARKWCGENSTHSHHIFLFTPIIALETSSHLRKNNNIGRMTQCAAVLDTSRRLSAMSGLLASACACAARKWCGENSTHSHHIFTPTIALETSSHLRNNNNGRMTQCAVVLHGPLLSRIGLYCHLSRVWLFNLGSHALYGRRESCSLLLWPTSTGLVTL